MENGDKYRLVFVTVGSEENALGLSRALVEERLAACCTILPKASSIYRWQEKIEESIEMQLLIKTSANLLNRVEQRIRQLHAYDTPEIMAVEINEISRDYAQWLQSSLAE